MRQAQESGGLDELVADLQLVCCWRDAWLYPGRSMTVSLVEMEGMQSYLRAWARKYGD